MAIVLTFTTANALMPQMVNVAAVDDLDIEGTHTSLITHTAASADSGYNGLAIAGNVVANIIDNDFATADADRDQRDHVQSGVRRASPGIGEVDRNRQHGRTAVDLEGWLFDDEDSTNWGAIPAGTMLNPSQVAVFYDTAFTTAATFRAEWSVPASALVVGRSGAIWRTTPGRATRCSKLLDDSAMQMDVVNFDDSAPWPEAVVGGSSIYLTNLSLENNTGGNWAGRRLVCATPLRPLGPTFNASDVGTPGWLPLAGDYNSNGIVDAADYTVWRDTLGSTSDFRADGSGSTPGVPDGVVDALDYDFWKANFGQTLVAGQRERERPNCRSGQKLSTAVAEIMSTVGENYLVVRRGVDRLGSGSTGSANAAVFKPTLRRLMAKAPDYLLLIVEHRQSMDEITIAMPGASRQKLGRLRDIDELLRVACRPGTQIAGAAHR